jgi:hypothetical protein
VCCVRWRYFSDKQFLIGIVSTRISKEIDLEVSAENTKYVIMFPDLNAGKNNNTVEQFKYLGTTVTNQNFNREEIKSRLNSGNACYYSVQNILSSSLLTENIKMKIYRSIILHVVLYRCETWSPTLREECRLRVFENRVLRRIFHSCVKPINACSAIYVFYYQKLHVSVAFCDHLQGVHYKYIRVYQSTTDVMYG